MEGVAVAKEDGPAGVQDPGEAQLDIRPGVCKILATYATKKAL